MADFDFSIIIPAHNEEKCIGKCLEAIETAAQAAVGQKVQVIVVANRCTVAPRANRGEPRRKGHHQRG